MLLVIVDFAVIGLLNIDGNQRRSFTIGFRRAREVEGRGLIFVVVVQSRYSHGRIVILETVKVPCFTPIAAAAASTLLYNYNI